MGDGNSNNVLVGVVGGIFRAALGATLPESVAESIESTLVANGYGKAGYASTDGVTQAMGTSTSNVTAWGGDTVRTVQTEHTLTYAFTPIEHNEQTLKMYYGEGATSSLVEINGEMLPVSSWVIPVRDGNKRIVIVIPRGQVTERGDVQYYGENAAGLPVTVTCYPDENGVKAYLYIGDLVITAPTITDIDPATGDITGGEVITITGTGFIDVREVRFGGNRALAAQAQSATEILAIAPAGSAGIVDVTVRAQGGTSATSPDTEYTYA